MERVVGLIENDTGERGWVRWDDSEEPVDFLLWFQSKDVEKRVRSYLSSPVTFEIVERRPRGKQLIPDDRGLVEVDVLPTKESRWFEGALRQMMAETNVRIDESTFPEA